MSTSKHTPGPWLVDAIGNVWADRDTKICDMREQPKQAECYRKKSDAEHEANARLIAAAPELLEALETLSTEEWRDDDDPVLRAARVKARAAIAKAKGQP